MVKQGATRAVEALGSWLITAAIISFLVVALPQSAQATSCTPHYSIHGRDSQYTLRAGIGMGGHGIGDGMHLGSATGVNCGRVASIFSHHDAYNWEELGAAQRSSLLVYDCIGTEMPDDGDWYRYWYEEVGNGTYFCAHGTQLHHQSANSHVVDEIYRDATNINDWHLYWGGEWLQLTAPVVSSGYTLGGTERFNTADSAYGNLQGNWYLTAGRTWTFWSNLGVWDQVDPDYIVNAYIDGFAICKC